MVLFASFAWRGLLPVGFPLHFVLTMTKQPPFWAENLHDLFTLIRTEEVIFEDNNLSDEAEDVLRKVVFCWLARCIAKRGMKIVMSLKS